MPSVQLSIDISQHVLFLQQHQNLENFQIWIDNTDEKNFK